MFQSKSTNGFGVAASLGAAISFRQLPITKKRKIFKTVVRYMFGLDSQRNTTNLILDLSLGQYDVTDAIANMKLSGRATAFKLWLFYIVKHKVQQPEASRLAKRWGVCRKDVREGLKLPAVTAAELRSIPYTALTLQEYNDILTAMVRDTSVWLKKFTYRKLRFVYQSNGMEQEDICQDLVAHGIRAIGVSYPRLETSLHAINIAKRAMHNQGQTIIKQATALKNQRLVQTSMGFEATVTPITEVQANYIPCPEAQRAKDNIEYRETARGILSRFSGKKRQFLELLGGTYNPAFDAYLMQHRKRECNSEDAGDKLSRLSHINMIAGFLNVPPKKCHALLGRIQKRFDNPFAA